MTSLSRWLRTPRPLRAAVGLLLAFVLAASGEPLGGSRASAPAARAAGLGEAAQRVRGETPVCSRRHVAVAEAPGLAPRVRARHRGLDLREGGLPAPRAPDAAPAA